MEFLASIGLNLLLPLLFVAGIIVLVVRRGLQMKVLANDGVETTGTVVRKLSFGGASRTSARRVRYEYVDQFGRTHSHRSTVPDDVYRSCEEGGPFPVVYSQSRPHVSAPKYLVEQSRAALAKR
jgi:hypothetical protein